MVIKTRIFGEVTIEDSKMILFPNGIVGFPELKDFALIHDEDQVGGIRWLQSVQEPTFAMPVIDPLIVKLGYCPAVSEEELKAIGNPEQPLILVTITVPSDLTKMSVNLKAPLIIDPDSRKACQVILEEDLAVRYPVYDILKAKQSKKTGE